MNTQEAALRGRIGAYVLHARRDSREVTAPARAAFLCGSERVHAAQGGRLHAHAAPRVRRPGPATPGHQALVRATVNHLHLVALTQTTAR